MFKLRSFRIYSADIGVFTYFDTALLSNFISFSNREFVAMTTYAHEIHSKMAYRLV
jgi:hypothetical protein